MEKLASASFFVSCENCIWGEQGTIALVDSKQGKEYWVSRSLPFPQGKSRAVSRPAFCGLATLIIWFEAGLRIPFHHRHHDRDRAAQELRPQEYR